MDDDEEISDNKPRSVSKKDTLKYANILQWHLQNCLNTLKTLACEPNVKKLRQALYINVPGLNFKTRIDKYDKEIVQLMKDWSSIWIKSRDNGMYYKPKTIDDLTRPDLSIYKRNKSVWWSETYLTFLQGLLADYEALMKAKGYVEEGTEMFLS